MKREYKDLSIDEKKEYHLLKNIAIEIPYSLVLLFTAIICLPLYFKYKSFWTFIIVLFIVFCFTSYSYYKDRKKIKELFDM